MGGSSKAQTVGYRYCLGMHVILTHGPVDKLTRVTFDKQRIAWAGDSTGGSIAVDQPNLFGGDEREGGVGGVIDFMPGGPSQTVNDYLASQLGEYTPAFRGASGLVFRGAAAALSFGQAVLGTFGNFSALSAGLSQFYFGNNPYLKVVSARLQRIHVTGTEGNTQWYDAKAEIPYAQGLPDAFAGWRYHVVPYTDTTDFSSPSFDDSTWDFGAGPFGDAYNANAGAAGFNPQPATIIGLENRVWLRTQITIAKSPTTFEFQSFVDNGIKCWINGVLAVDFTTDLGVAHNVTLPGSLFRIGQNDIAVMGFDDANGSPPGDRFYFDLRLQNEAQTNSDMNPAHIIRECLTDLDWGMGYQASDIDDTSFTAAADALYSEGMGMSLLWDRQIPIEDFVKEIVKHIDAALYVDRKTGKFTLKLIRNDYNVADLITLDEDNIDKVEGFKRAAFGELTNSVTVNYWDAETGTDASLTISDIALAQMQGATINTTLQYPGFTNRALASRVAQRDLTTLSTPLISCTIYANRVAADLTVGSVFKWTWPDYEIADLVMRVTGIAYGDGRNNRIRLTCVQDIFSLPNEAFIPPQTPAWEDPSGGDAVAVTNRLTFEVPYLELVQRMGQGNVDSALSTNVHIGYAGIAAKRPSASTINARVLSDGGSNGASYTDVDGLDFCPVATLGQNIDLTQNVIPINSAVELGNVDAGTWAQCGSEVWAVVALTATEMAVKRACLDTLPALHNAGDLIYFWDAYSSGDTTEYVSGESVKLKLLTSTGTSKLDEAAAPVDTVAITGRAALPYAPANLQLNSQYFPLSVDFVTDLAFTWAHRDRTQQTGATLYGFKDGSIGPESGVSYTLRIYGEADTLIRTASGLSSTSYTYTNATERSDSGLAGGAASYDDASIALTPLYFYKHDETSGSVMVDAMGVRNATYTSGATLAQSPFVSGGYSVAVNAGGYFKIPDDAATRPGTGEYSFFGWFKWTNSTLGMLYAKFDDVANAAPYPGPTVFTNCQNDTEVAGRIQLRDQSGAGYRVSSASSGLNDGTPRFYVFQRKQTSPGVWKLQIYINGTLDAEATLTSVLNHNQTRDAFYMGRPSQQNVAGGADGFGYINRSLTVTEISGLYDARINAGGSGGSSNRLNGRLRFELESTRNGLVSYQKYNFVVKRYGWAYNYGEAYGAFVGFGNYYGNSYGV